MVATATPKLTPKQLAFAHARLEGLRGSAAYAAAVPSHRLSPRSLSVEASRMEANPKVRAYVAAGLAEQRSQVLLNRDAKRLLLGGIARSRSFPPGARIQAIRADNEMTGDNAPVRVEGEITLHAVFSALRGSKEIPVLELAGATQSSLPPPPTAQPVSISYPEEPAGAGEQDAPP